MGKLKLFKRTKEEEEEEQNEELHGAWWWWRWRRSSIVSSCKMSFFISICFYAFKSYVIFFTIRIYTYIQEDELNQAYDVSIAKVFGNQYNSNHMVLLLFPFKGQATQISPR